MLRTSMIVLVMAACGGKKQDAPEREPAPAVRVEVDAGSPHSAERPALPPSEQPTTPGTAVESARDAGHEMVRLERRLDDLARRVENAVRAVADAKSVAEREAAKATFEALRRERAELDAEIAAARASRKP